MTINELSSLLYDSQLGSSLRESIYVFPLVEGSHLIGLALSVGLILFIDLRLLNVFLRNVPVSVILNQLRPWLLLGFAITFITGGFLFVAESDKVIHLAIFPIKLLFILLAGINALWFEIKWGKRVDEWQENPVFPRSVKFAGIASLILWGATVVSGRLIPYLSY